MIDKEDLRVWLTYDTTKAVLKVLREERDAISEALTNGTVLDLSSAESTGLKTTLLLGQLKGLNSILNITIEGED